MSLAIAIGVPFGALVSSGALGGMFLDKKLSTGPWLTVSGVVLGAVAAFANLIRVVKRLPSDDTTAREGSAAAVPPPSREATPDDARPPDASA